MQQRRRADKRLVRFALGVILTATCVKVWLGPVTMVPSAQAQIPDAGLQRNQLVSEVRKSNELLAQIAKTLKTQTLKARVEGTDKTGVRGARPARGRRP